MKSAKSIIAYISILALSFFAISTYSVNNIFVVLTFLAIILICTYHIFSPKNVIYGLSQIFYIFCLFFLGIAPLFQYLSGAVLWGGEPFRDIDFIETNMLIIMALVTYRYMYNKTFKKPVNIKVINNNQVHPGNISSLLLVIISAVTTIYIINIFDGQIMALLIRGKYAETDVVSDGGFSYLINSFFIRPIPAVCFLLYKFYNGKNLVAEIILLLLMLLTNAPTGMPRFAVAAFYIPVAFLYLKSLKKRHNFAFLMVIAIVVIFPFLNTFRAAAEGRLISLDMFVSAHFDSYQMFMRVVSTDFITYGRQLLGVIFFFVPRSLWPDKPIGSGYLVAHENGYFFDNLSMNFFGEGYINFGLIGVILFALFLGYINARMDRKYWKEAGSSRPLFSLIFFEATGMEFAIMRGALLNILPVLIGYILMTQIINFVAAKLIK